MEGYDSSETVEPSYEMMSKSSVIDRNYSSTLPRKFLVDDEYLKEKIDKIVNRDGQIMFHTSINDVKNADTPIVSHNMMSLYEFIDSVFDIKVNETTSSALIDAVF